jgi:hypothetical protein
MRVLAHGLGGRADLPIPVWLAQYAVALVLIVFFFFMLARFWRVPRLQEPYRGRPLPLGGCSGSWTPWRSGSRCGWSAWRRC